MKQGARQNGIAALLLFLLAAVHPLHAETIRVATYNASLARNGPGVLLLDLKKSENPQVLAVAEVIRTVRPDILLINEFDFDIEGLAAAQFTELLRKDGATKKGIAYPHIFARTPNTGKRSGFDLNLDGKTSGREDAFGYGAFHGHYGMLILSRFPILQNDARSFSDLRWVDFPGANLPQHPNGSPYPSAEAQQALRLSSKSHWDVPIDINGQRLHVLASHPTPPVFDGPEDFNGKRNGDEIRFWVDYLDGAEFADDQDQTAPRHDAPFVILGDLNADPLDGDGIHDAITALLTHKAVQDPRPRSDGAAQAALSQGGVNARHKTPPALDTADWNDKRGPGNLRVDYVLPSADLSVTDAGVFWPAPGAPGAKLIGSGKPVSSDHRLVWVDIDF